MSYSTGFNSEKINSNETNPLYAKKDSEHLLKPTNSAEVPKMKQVSTSRFTNNQSPSTKNEGHLKEKGFFRSFKESLSQVFDSAFDVDSRLEKELFGTEYKQAGAVDGHGEGVVSRDFRRKRKGFCSTAKSLRIQIKDALNSLYLTGGREVIKNQDCQVLDPYFFLEQIEQLQEKKRTKDKLKISLVKLHLKILGHQFSIGGEVKIRSRIIRTFIDKIKAFFFGEKVTEVALEWGFSSIAHAKIVDSFTHFAEEQEPKLENSDREVFERVLVAFEECSKQMENPKDNKEFGQEVKAIVSRYEAGEPITLSTGWDTHAIEIVLYKGMLCCSNRQCGEDSGTTFYAVPEGKIDEAFIKTLFMKKKAQQAEGLNYFKNEMVKDLNLKKLDFFKVAEQKVANCTFIQAKGGLRSLLFMLYLEQALKSSSMEMKDYLKFFTEHPAEMDGLAIYKAGEKAHAQAQETYKSWNLFNKREQFRFFVQFVFDMNKNNEIMDKKDEFKLLSKVMLRFGGKLEGHFSKNQYENHIEELMQEIKSKEYPLSDCIQEIPKDFSLRKPEELVKMMLSVKSSGAFAIYRSGDQVLVSCKGPDGKIVHQHLKDKGGVYYLEDSEKPLKNLSDLLDADKRLQYPVWSRRL